jgi:MFS family permease
MSNKKQYLLSCATVIAIFCMGQIPGSIDAAISKITTQFHLSSTTGLYVTTVASLTSVLFSIIVGMIAGKKIGYRKLICFCAIVEMLGALLPFFANHFVLILILRGLFGIGFGGMMSLENTVATILIPEEKRSFVLGLGTFFGFGTNCVLQFIGGILADISWNYVFLNHILLLIPFVILLFLCPDMDSLTKQQQAQTDDEHYSPAVFQMWVMMAFVGIIIAPLLIGCSFLSDAITPSATIAGIVAVCFSLGCMVGGLCYSKLFRLWKQHSLPIFLIFATIGVVGCGIVRTIPLLCIMIFIGGMGFSMTQASAMMILGLVTSVNQVAMASAGMMALFNLGMFMSSPFDSIVGKITGDSLYMPLFVGGVVLVLFALFFHIRSPFPKTFR